MLKTEFLSNLPFELHLIFDTGSSLCIFSIITGPSRHQLFFILFIHSALQVLFSQISEQQDVPIFRRVLSEKRHLHDDRFELLQRNDATST
jgi:hypothetical protein